MALILVTIPQALHDLGGGFVTEKWKDKKMPVTYVSDP
jgi:hypothetical protein